MARTDEQAEVVDLDAEQAPVPAGQLVRVPDPPDGYSPRKGDPVVVVMLAAGRPVHEAAAAAGVGVTAIRQRMGLAPYRVWVTDTRRAILEAAIGRLAGLVVEAVDTIADVMHRSRHDALRLGAAKAILAEYRHLSDYAELEARLAALEAATFGTGTEATRSDKPWQSSYRAGGSHG